MIDSAGEEATRPEGDASRDAADRRAVMRCLSGDTEAFAEIVARHQDRLMATAYHLLGERETAADAVQETFVRAYQSLASFGGDGHFGAWIGRIAVNVSISLLRSRAARPVTDAGAWDWGTADAGFACTEQRMVLRDALATLDVQDRAILLLRHLHGLSSQEIGAIVHLPPTTVRSRLARACDALRARLPDRDVLFDAEATRVTLARAAGEDEGR